MVLMRMEINEKNMAKRQVAKLVNESIEDVENGEKPIHGDDFFASMRKNMSNQKF